MSIDNSQWVRVSRQNPCPICDKPDNCEVSSDGRMVWCGRISEGSLRENAGGQFLHRLTEDWQRPIPLPAPTRNPRPRKDVAAEAARWFAFSQAAEARLMLAQHLGVAVASLEKLRVGWNFAGRFWSFPERDATGQIIGITRRFENGNKKRLAGCQAGLTYADNWDEGAGPILLPEGGSDTAAGLTIGLCVVGRPSNYTGIDQLVGLLERVPLERKIIVVAERDQKENGRWPGRDGAISTATQIAAALDRSIAWSLPPDDAKDMRAWLQGAPQSLPADRLADLFLTGLSRTWVHPVLRQVIPEPTGPAVELTDWRSTMLASRLATLSSPGCYLDASPTGSGKTNVDLQVLLHILKQESA